MKNKKWLLVLIIVFPSLFWLILETSTINSHRLPYFGPKKVIKAGQEDAFVTALYKGERVQLQDLEKMGIFK